MNAMVVGERREAVAPGIVAGGARLVEAPEVGSEAGEIRRIAGALRAFEAALGDGEVDRIVVAGASDDALAAVLVATKLRVPVVMIDGPRPPDDQPIATLNAVLIAQLADAALSDDATAVAAWLQEPEAASRPANGH